MRASELAKELKITEEVILQKLKSLKLKSKGKTHELNAMVVDVIRSEFKKGKKSSTVKTTAKEKTVKKTEKALSTTKKVKSTTTKAKTTAKATTKKVKKAPAKTQKKTTAKTTAKTTTKTIAKTTAKTTVKTPQTTLKGTSKIKRINIIDAPFEPVKPLAKKRKRPSAPLRGGPAHGAAAEAEARKAQQAKEADLQSKIESFRDEIPDLASLAPLEVKLPISVKDLAVRLQKKPSLLLKRLMALGLFATINQHLGEDVVRKLAAEFGFNITQVKSQEEQLIESHKVEQEDTGVQKARSPVVTFMGHVDHGKTSLLDKIRKTRITDLEHGGITQHIGASVVKLPKGKITFLDTPGHEAFTAMRARGAHITDLVVVVIAADEGIMPQTEEAIDHARAAKVPILVALNKIDKQNADADRVKKQLADKDLQPEDWGGKTVVVGVSAKTGEGIDQLLEMILLEAELLELKANYDKRANGIIIDAHLSHGRGAVASLIVQNGTLHEGDYIVVGPHYCKIRAMFDDHQKPTQTAGPATPVEILGLSGVPQAGDTFYVVAGERQAKEISLTRHEQVRREKLDRTQKITLEDLYSQIQQGTIKELNLIIKADVQGTLEALKDSLKKIPSDQIQIKFIHTGVGDINASDVILAAASNAIIIGFHVSIGPKAKADLEKNPVDIRTYRIIYDVVNDIRKALEGMLEPKTRKNFIGRVEIKQVFKLSKSGIVAGCQVVKGKVHRKAHIDITRNTEAIFSGTIHSLKRFKDDVREVGEGLECGITIEGFTDIQAGDMLEVYELEKIARKL